MNCDECDRARESGKWRRFNSLACEYCAARLIQRIKGLDLPRDRISERCTAALRMSVEHGLDEARIRALVKGPMALEPKREKKDQEQTKGKKT